jgi:hypothetical protein
MFISKKSIRVIDTHKVLEATAAKIGTGELKALFGGVE